MESFQGKRREDGCGVLKNGEYSKHIRDGKEFWYAVTPNNHLGDLSEHEVVEHEDGTITVTPSILVSQCGDNPKELWHGYLIKGVWKEC